jgi:hypothetical protein
VTQPIAAASGPRRKVRRKLRSTGNVWERHGLFRYGALVAARIAARRSNVRKKPPRTFELATSNLIIGSGVSRARSLPACNRAALCFRRNTFVCSAAPTKFSIDYLDTTVDAHHAAHHPADPSRRMQLRPTLSRIETCLLHGVLGVADYLCDLDDRYLLQLFWRRFRPAPAEDFTSLLLPHCKLRVVGGVLERAHGANAGPIEARSVKS